MDVDELTRHITDTFTGVRVAEHQGDLFFRYDPDGDRFAVAAVPEAQTTAKLDKVVLVFNFFDDLRRIAPIAKR